MRIVAGTEGMPVEPSLHKVRNQNSMIICVVLAKQRYEPKKHQCMRGVLNVCVSLVI